MLALIYLSGASMEDVSEGEGDDDIVKDGGNAQL